MADFRTLVWNCTLKLERFPSYYNALWAIPGLCDFLLTQRLPNRPDRYVLSYIRRKFDTTKIDKHNLDISDNKTSLENTVLVSHEGNDDGDEDDDDKGNPTATSFVLMTTKAKIMAFVTQTWVLVYALLPSDANIQRAGNDVLRALYDHKAFEKRLRCRHSSGQEGTWNVVGKGKLRRRHGRRSTLGTVPPSESLGPFPEGNGNRQGCPSMHHRGVRQLVRHSAWRAVHARAQARASLARASGGR
jgi:hypothetical protein